MSGSSQGHHPATGGSSLSSEAWTIRASPVTSMTVPRTPVVTWVALALAVGASPRSWALSVTINRAKPARIRTI